MTNKITFPDNGTEFSLEYDFEQEKLRFSYSISDIPLLDKTVEGDNLDLFFIYLNQILAKRIARKGIESKERYLAELILFAANVKGSSDRISNIISRWADVAQLSAYVDEANLDNAKSSNVIPNKIEAEVFIGLPQKEIDVFTIERIQNATGDFMEALGFELEAKDEPIYGSFYQKLKYLLKGDVKQEANEIYQKGKVALEAKYIDVPSAEVTEKLASAAANLITSLSGVSDAAIRCGSILIVKVTKDGVPRIVTETVSPELAALLNKNPALIQNPSIVFDLIAGMNSPNRTIEESGSAELIE